VKREEIVISTKVFFKTLPTNPIDLAKGIEIGLSRKHVIEGFWDLNLNIKLINKFLLKKEFKPV